MPARGVCPAGIVRPNPELWDAFPGGYFAVIKGYFDESYNDRVFSFGGWLAGKHEWKRVEKQWQGHVNRVNWRMPQDRRISRYHAADCSSLKSEFSAWTIPERDALCISLKELIAPKNMYAIACGVVLDDLLEVFPDTTDEKDTAYSLALKSSMFGIGHVMETYAPEDRVTVFVAHGPYDATAVRSFNAMKDDQDFPCRDYFTTIAPLRWEQSVALQPADMICYELFKELDRKLFANERQMRRFLKELMGDKSNIGIRSKFLNKAGLRELRAALESRQGL